MAIVKNNFQRVRGVVRPHEAGNARRQATLTPSTFYCDTAFGNSEIRVSFRTGFKKEAIAMAKKVHEHISAKLEAGDFADPGL